MVDQVDTLGRPKETGPKKAAAPRARRGKALEGSAASSSSAPPWPGCAPRRRCAGRATRDR
ncbi:hypothetical protein ACFQX6_62500 [Streptosporangium lutulentum]